MPRLDGAASCLEVVSSNHYAFESNKRRETSHLDLSSEFREKPSSSFSSSEKSGKLTDNPFIKNREKPSLFVTAYHGIFVTQHP
jgi:hypothetical protein